MTTGCSCTTCGGPTEVRDSRGVAGDNSIRRRRFCVRCDVRFTTFEEIREEPSQSTTSEPFRHRRVTEVREIMHDLSLDDQRLLLGMARRLAGLPAEDERSRPDLHREPVFA